MKITVFTPTYNRAHLLGRLYKSLVSQTFIQFEWIVVDDGSTDNTLEILNEFVKEQRIDIKVFHRTNGGKQRATNFAVNHAQGELFFIVDSDDYLIPEALEIIDGHWQNVVNKDDFYGIGFRRINYNSMKIVGPNANQKFIDSNHLEIINKYKITGDKAEVFNLSVFRRFPYPEIEGERFVTESLIYHRMSKTYKMRFVNVGIYMAEYLSDGITRNFNSYLKRNPKAFSMYYTEYLTNKNIPALLRVKALIRLIQCKIYILMK